MVTWTKTQAFASFGTVCKNPRWSWSGRSDDGRAVALTFWTDGFVDFRARPIIYQDVGWTDPATVNRPGNRERMENIQWALDNLGGLVRVVVAKAKDPLAEPRKIEECYPQPKLIMRIASFNDRTGEWSAQSVEQAASDGQ